jgi:hypothetical protein
MIKNFKYLFFTTIIASGTILIYKYHKNAIKNNTLTIENELQQETIKQNVTEINKASFYIQKQTLLTKEAIKINKQIITIDNIQSAQIKLNELINEINKQIIQLES